MYTILWIEMNQSLQTYENILISSYAFATKYK